MTLASCRAAAVLLAALSFLLPAAAAPFEVAVVPSRFELSGKGAARIGESLRLQNVGTSPAEVALRTLDWSYSDQGGISYHEELMPASCRPWVTLERKRLTLPARGQASFRFQVDVPKDAPRGECRFMLAIESVEPAFVNQIGNGGASISLPVSGRIAIAVYVAVNGAEPKMEVAAVGMGDTASGKAPSITVRNVGDAHGRLEGGLEAVDAQGRKFELVPEASPIMPGQTRTLPLVPRAEPGQKPLLLAYPVKGNGRIDWENGSFKIDAEFK